MHIDLPQINANAERGGHNAGEQRRFVIVGDAVWGAVWQA